MLVIGQKDGSISAKYTLKKTEDAIYMVKSFTDCWYVCTDDVTQTEQDVRAEFVALGTFYKGAYLKEISPKEMNTIRHPETGVLALFFEVDLDYDSDFSTDNNDDNPNNVNVDDPTDTRPLRRIYCEQEEGVLEKDAQTGKAVTNSNGERLIVPKLNYSVTLEITRYENLINFTDGIYNIGKFVNHVNRGTFYGLGDNIALMKDIRVEEVVITNTQGQKILWGHVTYVVNFRIGDSGTSSGHFAQPLNEGYLVRPWLRSGDGRILFDSPDPNNSHLETYKDSSGQPMKTNLSLDGTKLFSFQDPIFLVYNKHDAEDFGPLGLEY